MPLGRDGGKPTVLLAGLSACGLALGLAREASIAHVFGASWESDAYYTAAFPAALLLDLGTDLGLALLPTYIIAGARGGSIGANRLFGFLIRRVTAIAAGSILLLAATSTWWLPRLAPGLPPAEQDSARLAIWVLAPGLCSILPGMAWKTRANALGRFALPALAALLPNLGVIAGATLLATTLGVPGITAGLATGLLVSGTVLCFASRGGETSPCPVAPAEPDVPPGFLSAWLLVILGAVMYKLEPLILRHYAPAIGAGELTSLIYGSRLAYLPNTLFTLAFATVMFPRLTRLSLTSTTQTIRFVRKALLASLVALFLMAVTLAATRGWLVALLFEHGRFTADDGERTAKYLLIYSLSIVPLGLSIIMVRVVAVFGRLRLYAIGGTLALAAYWVVTKLTVSTLGGTGLALANVAGNLILLGVLLGGVGRRLWTHDS